jgi:uncharacterized protein (TIGR01244 family)
MATPLRLLIILAAVLASACASRPARDEGIPVPPAAAPSSAAPSPAPASAMASALVRDRVILAGQPTAADLEAWRDQGVTTVFNLRTPTETDDRAVVSYDEAAQAAALGLDYRHQPVGGKAYPYRPEVLEAFAASMAATDGPVLLHCGTGVRAGLLYAAYAVKYLGHSPDQAMRELEPLGLWPLPLEQLTGIELSLDRR